MSETLIFLIEIIGTVAFAVSGAIVALESRLDLFGVIALGVFTATFGGIFRDLVLGVIPPSSFVHPVYVMTAIGTSVVFFIVAATVVRHAELSQKARNSYTSVLFWMDSFGLGIFTVMGVSRAYQLYGSGNLFLLVFCGLITGVGGGLLRDMVVNRPPVIFTKHIYAVASILGALVMTVFLRFGHEFYGLWVGCAVVIILRYLAMKNLWNLPKISDYHQ